MKPIEKIEKKFIKALEEAERIMGCNLIIAISSSGWGSSKSYNFSLKTNEDTITLIMEDDEEEAESCERENE